MTAKIMDTKSRFWQKADISNSKECWLWRASKHPDGYGRFRLNGQTIGAHRVAWQLTNGNIADGYCVCHTCDNPACVNPSHLFIGTHSDNMKDRDCKGRNRVGVGEKQHLSKLRDADVRKIRNLLRCGCAQKEIATYYDVCQSTISQIHTRVIWKHL